MNISNPTIKALHELTGDMFQMNRWWDSALSVLKINFVCDNSASLIHPYIAHAYPAYADEVTEILEKFNVLAIYPATTEGDIDYNSIQDIFQKMLDRTIDLQNKLMGAMDIAVQNKDYLVKVELDKVLLEINEQVAQAILLRDKAEQYGDKVPTFDHQIGTFFFLNE